MNAMNQIIIEGNIVRAPTHKETPRGTKVTTVPIAVNHFYKDSSGRDVDEVGFYEVETWGEKFSALMAKYALQGRGVRIVGRLKQDRWKDENGKNHSKVFIVAEHVDFKPMKKNNVKSDENADDEKRNLAIAAQGLAQEESVF